MTKRTPSTSESRCSAWAFGVTLSVSQRETVGCETNMSFASVSWVMFLALRAEMICSPMLAM
jgi:hypothetical protein